MVLGSKGPASLVMYASLFEELDAIGLEALAESDLDTVPILNASRFFSIDQMFAAAASRQRTMIKEIPAQSFPYTRKTAAVQQWSQEKFFFVPENEED